MLTTDRRALLAAAVCLALFSGDAEADEWLVYVQGGIEPIVGAWKERPADVMFTKKGGTLVSVPYEDVDLATSAFITWQLNGRRGLPPLSGIPEGASPGEGGGEDGECSPATIARFQGGETFDLAHDGAIERVHAACLDAPETSHRLPELGWFGRAMASAVQIEVKIGDAVCVSEQQPPRRDEEGHRVVHLTLEGGRDYSREVIAGGLGLLRPAGCERAAEYRRLEARAVADGRGLWGAMAQKPALAAAKLVVSVGGVASAAPVRGSGGG